ncbi:hypothetical protein LJB71_02415 [Thermomonas sp. S9]|uniref:hypothetical protein n=1 Tax=Thermomonas sp. S9 TaxID=2885203 RepID=UPI00216B3461|nr:hypothetical protein [Thermomonas sp. S9]MCR6495208.1 hypothetical protein [Thermomonas sp. S9]
MLRLQKLAQAHGDSLEQRKAAWTARAYAAALECAQQPRQARLALDATLTDMQLALPEGGALPREVQQLRAQCGTRPQG